MVEPITTCASGEIPFTAATVRVVRLFAAAMDQRVSPGLNRVGHRGLGRGGQEGEEGDREQADAKGVKTHRPRGFAHRRGASFPRGIAM